MSKKNARKSKTNKKRRLNFKKVFVLLCVLAFFIVVTKILFDIPIKSVVISGNSYVKETDIIKLGDLDKEQSFFGLNVSDTCNKIKSNAMIDGCNIKKDIGFKINVVLTENRPLFYYLNSNKLVLSNKDQIDDNNSYGVPNLINYTPKEVLDKFIDGLNGIKSDIIQNTSEIEYAPSQDKNGTYLDKERFMLSMRDGNIVYINIRNIDVLNKYDKMYASLGDRKGIYNLDSDYGNYVIEEFDKEE